MIEDIKNHERSKEVLLPFYIQKRMDLSIKNYYEELMQTYDELMKKDAFKVIKRMFPRS